MMQRKQQKVVTKNNRSQEQLKNTRVTGKHRGRFGALEAEPFRKETTSHDFTQNLRNAMNWPPTPANHRGETGEGTSGRNKYATELHTIVRRFVAIRFLDQTVI